MGSQGRVIWITGLSGAGKTTLARALAARLPQAVLLDGDDLRAVLGATASGFDRAGRLALAHLCPALQTSGGSGTYGCHCHHFPVPRNTCVEQGKSARLPGSFSGCSRGSAPQTRSQGAVCRRKGRGCAPYGRSRNRSRFPAGAASRPAHSGIVTGGMPREGAAGSREIARSAFEKGRTQGGGTQCRPLRSGRKNRVFFPQNDRPYGLKYATFQTAKALD